MAFGPDGCLYVAEQQGRSVWTGLGLVFQPGISIPTPPSTAATTSTRQMTPIRRICSSGSSRARTTAGRTADRARACSGWSAPAPASLNRWPTYLEPHSSADGFAFWHGRIYLAEWGTHKPSVFGKRLVEIAGSKVSVLASGFEHPPAVVVDRGGDALLVADWGRGLIYRSSARVARGARSANRRGRTPARRPYPVGLPLTVLPSRPGPGRVDAWAVRGRDHVAPVRPPPRVTTEGVRRAERPLGCGDVRASRPCNPPPHVRSNSRAALRLAELARERRLHAPAHERLMEPCWTEAQDMVTTRCCTGSARRSASMRVGSRLLVLGAHPRETFEQAFRQLENG